jgi:tetratricopeptide (TPR) repeat protein
MRSWGALALVVAFSTSSSSGQSFGRGSESTSRVTIRVAVAENHPVAHASVRLISLSGAALPQQSTTDDQGVAVIDNVAPGDYSIGVSGADIQPIESGNLEIREGRISPSFTIWVRPLHPALVDAPGGSAFISVTQVAVPEKAKTELRKAHEALAKKDFEKAIARLRRALEIFPGYAPAYNNLGVVYEWMNDRRREREALENAVRLDDHLAPAYVNLARLNYQEKNYGEAETLLEKADASDPQNVNTLTLLANTQLLNRNYDGAIATARAVHDLSKPHSALVHYISARALEHTHRAQDAIAQLQRFLEEEPKGTRADLVRSQLEALKKSGN